MRDLNLVLEAMEEFHTGMIIGALPKELALTGICGGLLHFILSIQEGMLEEAELLEKLEENPDMKNYWDRKDYYFVILQGMAAMKLAN